MGYNKQLLYVNQFLLKLDKEVLLYIYSFFKYCFSEKASIYTFPVIFYIDYFCRYKIY